MKNIENFRKSLKFILKWEVGNKPNGGYHNDPSDPGGETKWGISKGGNPNVDIPNLTPEQAADIYINEYWDPAGCDALVYPLCTVVFDSAVQHGVKRALTWLRNATNVSEYFKLRSDFYLSIAKTNPTNYQQNKGGWSARLNDLKKLVEVTQQEVGYDVTKLPDWHY